MKHIVAKAMLCACAFLCLTPLSALNYSAWGEVSSQPIYTSTHDPITNDAFPCVIYSPTRFDDHGAAVPYKMWHQDETGIQLSYSEDGQTWKSEGLVLFDISNAPDYPKHACVVYNPEGFPADDDNIYYYQMWYWDGEYNLAPPQLGIKFAQSKDGVEWTDPIQATQDSDNFLANSSQVGVSPFWHFYGFGQVIYNSNSSNLPGHPYNYKYVAYYDVAQGEQGPFTTQESIGLAYSADGIHWIRHGTQPVLMPAGNDEQWDGRYAYRPAVIIANGRFHMFYSGANNINNPDQNFAYAFGIGHAISLNGIDWFRDHAQPIFSVLDGQAWRAGRVLAPSVVMITPTFFKMWFSGGTNSATGTIETAGIGYATLGAIAPPDKGWVK